MLFARMSRSVTYEGQASLYDWYLFIHLFICIPSITEMKAKTKMYIYHILHSSSDSYSSSMDLFHSHLV